MSEFASEIMNNAEMTEKQLIFLCSLLEENRPKKIVEIGVAAGGTSVVILDKLISLDYEAKMFSVDLSREYYRDKKKLTGYLIDNYVNSHECKKVFHKKMIGDYVINYLQEIGKDIDFLILDTVHSLPGEIFDFLALLPFLNKSAIVVLHDITLNHLSNNREGIATQVLLDCVVGEKLTPISIYEEYPGIGAFKINEDTFKYIDDVFNAMMITWKYIPSESELILYRNHYLKYYSQKQAFVFDEAIRYNRNTALKAQRKKMDDIKALYNFFKSIQHKKVYIYGNGYISKKIENILYTCNIPVEAHIVSKKDNEQFKLLSMDEFIHINNIASNNYAIIVGVVPETQQEIISTLCKYGIDQIVLPTDQILQIIS